MKIKKNSPATPAASLQIVLTGNNRERDINQIQTTYKIQPNLIWHQNSEPKISPPTYKFQTPISLLQRSGKEGVYIKKQEAVGSFSTS